MIPTVLVVLYLVGLLVLVGGGFALYFLVKRRRSRPAGKDSGTSRAASLAKRWARGHGFRVIAPAQLARKGSFAHLDAIVIGYFGVLGVKAYGYNGEIYGTKDDDDWLQVAPGGEREYFKNPIDEASADVRVIRDALFESRIKMTPVEVVCVFTNKRASVAVPKSTGHFTMKTFKDQLDKEKYREDKGVDLDKAEAAIRGAIVSE